MVTPPRPPAARVLGRALRLRCPACGRGRIFAPRSFRSVSRCASCTWRLERGPGHWVGGSEINMLLTYPTTVALLVLSTLVFGLTVWTAVAGALLSAGLSVGLHRHCKAIFFALDYLIDPDADPATGAGEDERLLEDPDPRAPRPLLGPALLPEEPEDAVTSGVAPPEPPFRRPGRRRREAPLPA